MGPHLKMMLAPLIMLARRRCYAGTCDFEPVSPLASGALDACAAATYADAGALGVSPADASMVRLEGPFWCFAVGNLREGGGATRPLPHVRAAEGAADLLVCRDSASLSRWRCMQLLLRLDEGSHVRAPDVQVQMRRSPDNTNTTPP